MSSPALSVVDAAELSRRAAEEAETVELILPQLTRFLAREVDSAKIDATGIIPPAVRQGAGELGLFGLTIPVEHGGVGLSLGAACKLIAEVARVDRSTAIMIGLHLGLGIRGLVDHGSDELKRNWLPRLASGEVIASFAATEAGAGSDLNAVRTTGERVPEGIRINGEKSYVTNGGFCGLITALVRTPGIGGNKGFCVVSIPRETPGVHIGKEEHKLGIKGSSTVTVTFEGAVVPWTHVLGEPGRGMDQIHGLLAWGRTLMSAGCVGTARAALDAATAYVTTRKQFGRPVGDFGATRAHIAWMAARLRAMNAIVQSVAADQARGLSIETGSAIAKVFSSDSAFTVCDRALQLHGALGFIEETGVARMLRDCRITRIFEGANDVLLVRIGAARLASPAVMTRDGDAPALAELARRFDASLAEVRTKYGISAIRRQLVLQRIADAEVALTVGRAVVSSDPLDQFAADQLAREGHIALDALTRAERDEELSSAIAAGLYVA